jgi:hypothetical protein
MRYSAVIEALYSQAVSFVSDVWTNTKPLTSTATETAAATLAADGATAGIGAVSAAAAIIKAFALSNPASAVGDAGLSRALCNRLVARQRSPH